MSAAGPRTGSRSVKVVQPGGLLTGGLPPIASTLGR
jgi:hypothetical protein